MMTTNMKAQSVLGATVAAAALMLVSVIALAPAPARAGPLLEDAISWNDVAKVREILTNKLEEVDSEDDYGHTALQYAIRLGNLDIAKMLVEYGADTKIKTEDGHSLFDLAIHNNPTVDSVKYLTQGIGFDRMSHHGEMIDDDGESALHKMIHSSHFNDVIKHLIHDVGFDINVKGGHMQKWEGSTPLHEVARGNNRQQIEFLLNNGADVKAVDADGNTALHALAVRPDDFDIIPTIEALLKAGLSLTDKNRFGDTPLDVAKLYKDHYHRYLGVHEVLDALGYSDEDINPKYEYDMEKRETDQEAYEIPLIFFDHNPFGSQDI